MQGPTGDRAEPRASPPRPGRVRGRAVPGEWPDWVRASPRMQAARGPAESSLGGPPSSGRRGPPLSTQLAGPTCRAGQTRWDSRGPARTSAAGLGPHVEGWSRCLISRDPAARAAPSARSLAHAWAHSPDPAACRVPGTRAVLGA